MSITLTGATNSPTTAFDGPRPIRHQARVGRLDPAASSVPATFPVSPLVRTPEGHAGIAMLRPTGESTRTAMGRRRSPASHVRRMLATTPTTRTTGASSPGVPSRTHSPIGFLPGQRCAASASLTTSDGGPAGAIAVGERSPEVQRRGQGSEVLRRHCLEAPPHRRRQPSIVGGGE